ncbi:hypothetical protein MHBO_000995 [Bonamia ostreae]|uniref:Uncharacterized protein n=1 Tax=Bonamia ostreae TaxID=126728 RepID=A0ABV2AHH4_9EUKA
MATTKTQFISYLESNGVIEALSDVLLEIYEKDSKPENPLNFIKSKFSPEKAENKSEKEEIENLKKQLAEKEEKIKALLKQIEDLKDENAQKEGANNGTDLKSEKEEQPIETDKKSEETNNGNQKMED